MVWELPVDLASSNDDEPLTIVGRSLVKHAQLDSSMSAFTPDGRQLAHPTSASTVAIWSLDDRETRSRIDLPEPWRLGGSLSFSPDGRYLCIPCVGGKSGDRSIQVWEQESKKFVYDVPLQGLVSITPARLCIRRTRLWSGLVEPVANIP